MITIEGRNPVLESLRAGQNIADIYIKEGVNLDTKINEIIELAREKSVRYKFVSKRFLDNMVEDRIHQGVVAVRLDRERRKLNVVIEDLLAQNIDPFIIYIREAQNEFNVGAIVRSAECAGVNLVILPPKTHMTPQMIRSSMGATEHIEVVNENLFNSIKTMHEFGIKVVGIELTGDKFYFEEKLIGSVMLLIGGEDRSLSAEVTNKCDSVIKIPQHGHVNSLNMSVAASIVLFEKVRQDLICKS